ncbi:hypothetical protein BOTBODRAFT_185985 [Botryobasidium botryosum FD-172 SS1]|uniref:UvrD-like helicase ATP-binding domain-containing protein n=1 Tax=Botryobasidium botryosum (strain FD-172 SS1) TaxID=930990 RepID=A0A067MZH3_BOTB1|nr:hypothetical protein BOTBODRAFT_185985 [Botryobasidium botryosum FD-172 SS1]
MHTTKDKTPRKRSATVTTASTVPAQPSTHALSFSLFAPSTLKDEQGLQRALLSIQKTIQSASDYQKVVWDVVDFLLSVPNLCPFIILASRYSPFDLLTPIIQSFHDAPSFGASVGARVLDALRNFYIALPPSSTPRELDGYHRSVPCLISALHAIPSLFFIEPFIPGEVEVVETRSKPKKQTQRQAKMARRASQSVAKPAVDHRIFADINAPVPESSQAAHELEDKIIIRLKAILTHYLSHLHDDGISTFARALYLVPVTADTAVGTPAPPRKREAEVAPEKSIHMEPSEPEVLYPKLLPIRIAQFLEADAKPGTWQIHLSGKAVKHMRLYRRDSHIFEIIKNKLEQLATGHFSKSNQKVLAGARTDVPLYEAKMTRDLRLVYQIDCTLDVETQSEKQVIKVYGIYTHAQFDNRLWDSVAYHTSKMRREERKRALFRDGPKRRGEDIHSPREFSSAMHESSTLDAVVEEEPPLSREELLEVHALLALEKFFPYSKSVEKCILAELESTHVFALSPKEQEIASHPSSCYVLGRSGTGKTTTMLFRMLFRQISPSGLKRPLRQLFVTQSRVLAERVEEYYNQLLQTYTQSPAKLAQPIKQSVPLEQESNLIAQDDEDENQRKVYATGLSQMQDQDFQKPLFLTFDQTPGGRLSSAPKADDGEDESLYVPLDRHSNLAPKSNVFNKPITYEEFLKGYWPRFSPAKGLDPAMAWSELMGVIRGSEGAMESKSGYLSREQYMSLSHRTNPTFARHREQVYDIFEMYMRRKRKLGRFDPADRTHSLLRGLSSDHKAIVDFLYVDEAQDNLLIDAHLLRSLCRNPRGLFWAGDTAQTISVGCSFRFEDLKATLYRLEEADNQVKRRIRAPEHPLSFQLAINYRSHGGIIDAASSIIDLISDFFPYSIDKLERETGLVSGPKPAFFDGWTDDALRQFIFGNKEARIEFGAHQCIIVRNPESKAALKARIGDDAGRILTPYQAKGLEFNDANSSASNSEWRVVLNALKDQGFTAPTFDDIRHASICSELKCLYVALTRARNNCWISDTSQKAGPMKQFWMSRQQVQVVRSKDEIPHFAANSTEAEWEKAGEDSFNRKQYEDAILCFGKAGLELKKAISSAYLLREQARAILFVANSNDLQKQTTAFSTAADAFWECGQNSSGQQRLGCFRRSGECYEEAGQHRQSAEAYRMAGDLTSSAKQFRKAGVFDQCVKVIKENRAQVDEQVANNLLDVSKFYYLKNRQASVQNGGAKTEDIIPEGLFDSPEDLIEGLKSYGFDDARADELERRNEYSEAAKLRLKEGNHFRAIELFRRAEGTETSKQIVACLFDGLWVQCSMGALSVSGSSECEKLLNIASALNPEEMSAEQRQELEIFRAIFKKDAPALRKLAFRCDNNPALSIHCLDFVLSKVTSTPKMLLPEVHSTLEACEVYGRMMRATIMEPNICNLPEIQKLIGFWPTTDSDDKIIPNEFRVSESSVLRTSFQSDIATGDTIKGEELADVVRQMLIERLYTRLLDTQFAISPSLKACLQHAVYRSCDWPNCNHIHFEFSREVFNQRVQVHLLQIMVLRHLNYLWTQDQHPRLAKARGFLLRQLFEMIFPPWYRMGNFAALSFRSVPIVQNALQLTQSWVRNQQFNINSRASIPFFLNSVAQTGMLVMKYDRAAGSSYVFRAPWGRNPAVQGAVHHKLNRFTIHDLFYFLNGNHPERLAKGVNFMKYAFLSSVF